MIKGQVNPVVKIIDESNGEWIYALRINGTRFRPKVFQGRQIHRSKWGRGAASRSSRE